MPAVPIPERSCRTFINAHFEGDAAGEVFNGDGKTDILIRAGNRNIFIGECKVWDGPGAMDEALGQIFSYLVWRDTKAAILLFIRNKDVTAVINKAVDKIETHPNFKRRRTAHTDEQLDFVMHAQDDAARLALLPFAPRTAGSAAMALARPSMGTRGARRASNQPSALSAGLSGTVAPAHSK
jgi:hypothetical protein